MEVIKYDEKVEMTTEKFKATINFLAKATQNRLAKVEKILELQRQIKR